MASQFRGVTALETHGAILDLIRSRGEVSRTELVDRSGLTGASITRIIRQLMDDGLVVESGQAESTGGKPRTLLQLNPSARAAVGVSLDRSGITYVITDLAGQVVARRTSTGAGSQTPYAVTQRIAGEVRSLLEGSGSAGADLLGVGIAISGPQDSPFREVRTDPQATDWDRFDLRHTLGSALGTTVIVENDATCAAIGEFWTGRFDSSETLATVYMTTGFGLGLVIRGDSYRGASANPGAISHVSIDSEGPPCPCGRRGCLFTLASVFHMVEVARADSELSARLRLRSSERTVPKDYEKLAIAAGHDQPDARAIVQASADALASVLVSVTNLLDLTQLILAGPGFRHVEHIYANTVQERLTAEACFRDIHPTTVVVSASGADSAALGAASLVLQTQLTRGRGPIIAPLAR